MKWLRTPVTLFAAGILAAPTAAMAADDLFTTTIPDGPDAGISPEINQVVVSIPRSDPALLVIRMDMTAPVPEGYTRYGQAAAFFDTDGDGVDNFGAVTPGGEPMMAGWDYVTPLYRNIGNNQYSATSASARWVRESTTFTVAIPWRSLGSTLRLWAGVGAGDGTSDIAPAGWSAPITPKTFMVPKKITGVKIKKRSGRAIVRWKAQPVAKRYLVTAKVKGKKQTLKTKRNAVTLVAKPKSKVVMTVRGKGDGGLGPVKRIKFRMK